MGTAGAAGAVLAAGGTATGAGVAPGMLSPAAGALGTAVSSTLLPEDVGRKLPK